MKIKTSSAVLSRVHDALGRGSVIKHEPTTVNPLGQSGFHTLTDDIMNVMEEARGIGFHGPEAGKMYRALASFLQNVNQFKEQDTQDYCPKCCNIGECKCKRKIG